MWTAPYNIDYGYFNITKHTISPTEQTAEPFNITFRFADAYGDCDMRFPPFMQALQREILYGDLQNAILPPHIQFQELPSTEQADINYVLCKDMDSSGRANYPNSNGGGVYIHADLAEVGFWGELKESIGYYSPTAYVRNVLLHEAGHAFGLDHTHIEGEQGNKALKRGFTQHSSIMSYDADSCYKRSDIISSVVGPSLSYQASYLLWEQMEPIRTQYGPVDIINLRYAYDPAAPSIGVNVTDSIGDCLARNPSVVPTTYLVPEMQIAIGAGLALLALACSIAKRKGNTVDVDALDAVGDPLGAAFKVAVIVPGLLRPVLELATSTPKENATSHEIAVNVGKDILLTGARMLCPVAAVVHDMTYNVGDALFQSNSLKQGAINLVAGIVVPAIGYVGARASGVPLYGVYQYAAADEPRELEGDILLRQIKKLSRYVVNIRAVRHGMPDSVTRWANGVPVRPHEEASGAVPERDVEMAEDRRPPSRVNTVEAISRAGEMNNRATEVSQISL